MWFSRFTMRDRYSIIEIEKESKQPGKLLVHRNPPPTSRGRLLEERRSAMKTRLSHLLTMLLWLAMLTAYVVALSYLPHAPGLLLILPAGVGCIGGQGVVRLPEHESPPPLTSVGERPLLLTLSPFSKYTSEGPAWNTPFVPRRVLCVQTGGSPLPAAGLVVSAPGALLCAFPGAGRFGAAPAPACAAGRTETAPGRGLPAGGRGPAALLC